MGSVGDFVWFDMNGDGIQDMDEPGLGGIRVVLRDSTGTELAAQSTDMNGMYLFEDLLQGVYTVEVTQRNDLLPTFDLDGGLDNEAMFTLPPGVDKRDVDFGFDRKSNLSIFISSMLTVLNRASICW